MLFPVRGEGEGEGERGEPFGGKKHRTQRSVSNVPGVSQVVAHNDDEKEEEEEEESGGGQGNLSDFSTFSEAMKSNGDTMASS